MCNLHSARKPRSREREKGEGGSGRRYGKFGRSGQPWPMEAASVPYRARG